MSLILRNTKGSPLTFAEGDANLVYLENLALSGSNINTSSLVTISSFNAFTSSYNTGSFTGSFIGDGSGLINLPIPIIDTSSLVTTSSFNAFTSSYNTGSFTGSFVGDLEGTADTASYAPNYLPLIGGGILSGGDLTITQNLIVQGTASIQEIQYVSQSTLNIGTNLITVNTSTPAVRFGGLAVYDSGSLATGLTGSLLWDSENNVWIYTNPSGAAYDGGMILTGPRNSSGIGNEVGIATNALAKGDGSHHVTSSQITDDGTTVSIPGNLIVTGSLNTPNLVLTSSGSIGLGTSPDYGSAGQILKSNGPGQPASWVANNASTNTGEKLYTFYNFY